MITPVRIQRKRTKGWKKPEGAIYVGRGTKYGNPFIIGVHGTREQCLQLFKSHMEEMVITKFNVGELLPEEMKPRWLILDVPSLKGKNLMCFCKTEEACHADYLIKKANES